MDLLGGYHSSSSEDENDDEQQRKGSAEAVQRRTPELTVAVPPMLSLRRPPPGAGGLNAAPIPSVPIAVLRAQGVVPGGRIFLGSAGNRSLVVANTSLASSGPVQGPSALCDPSDRTASFLRSVDSKTG
eukprot:CAMPEP_0172558876 /NCGR_PEP_ID=MMETSP1067-20121228/81392_1 /TAXON_ID=265564 ORGANISM="Thalassiosira punctigera, Strain Tpunct2005C2" /NCGR_SAMPLE_ID=MMETSP1067 /ASSEMBLY_ACC=CAM_ASM_000444 /LENGTH=128 /DNA_ID=CAMNT_0013348331 /DNA_START=35 /DNA_END=417 /DNA_ORIENTATION=+